MSESDSALGALDPGPVQNAAKMGALFRFAAAMMSDNADTLKWVEKQDR